MTPKTLPWKRPSSFLVLVCFHLPDISIRMHTQPSSIQHLIKCAPASRCVNRQLRQKTHHFVFSPTSRLSLFVLYARTISDFPKVGNSLAKL